MRCAEVIKEAEEGNTEVVLELEDIFESSNLSHEFDRKVQENIEYILRRNCLWREGLRTAVLICKIAPDPDDTFFGYFQVFDGTELVARGEFGGTFVVLDERAFEKPDVEGIEIVELTISLPPVDAKKLFLLDISDLGAEEKAKLLSWVL
ncbi:hypothetical protein Ferp_0560 [Ferroglobus placidus DSM 10642]|uniref:Uncharacterized protein n=1 Tax=Ferroglobus placidus (strain DSM 10642 / AEDII12DO) TaxID=589924 RepID=D3S3A0_FERPA|nr:hypothetical protein [Ferroglobus placidus]ADC64733.1 hypothetical protein Ferp_0560 [Ferroglobus placidus DSM 10642]